MESQLKNEEGKSHMTGSSDEENSSIAVEEVEQSDGNLEPEVRVGMAIYLTVLNEGKMTEHGALLPNGLNMHQVAKQAEVSVNYAIKATTQFRKQGFIRNRKEDGRLLIKITEMEEMLSGNGAILD